MYDAIVIGGGITGLCCAYRLRNLKKSVALIEPDQLGGCIRTVQKDGFNLEQGPNVFLLNEAILHLLEELGLGKQITYPQVEKFKQYIWYDGQPTAVPKSPFAFFGSKMVSLSNRLLFIPRVLSRGVATPQSEDESVRTFVERILGEKAVTNMIDPALKGIYGGNADTLSARSLFGKLWEHSQNGGSIFSYLMNKKKSRTIKRKMFVIKGGMETMITALSESIGSDVALLRSRAANISTSEGGSSPFTVTTESGDKIEGLNLYVATSGHATAKFISSLSPDLADMLKKIRYAAIAVVHAAVGKDDPVPDDSFGTLFPKGQRTKLLGVMYNSSLFPHVAPEGKHLLTIMFGGVDENQIYEMKEEELFSSACEELTDKLNLKNARPLDSVTWKEAIPQYELGHYKILDKMKEVEEKFPGLHFIGVDQGGIGVPDRIAKALEINPGEQVRAKAA